MSYANTLQNAHLIRVMASNLNADGSLDEAIFQARHAESSGWIVDPTAFREKADRLREDIETLCAVRDLARLAPTSTPEQQ